MAVTTTERPIISNAFDAIAELLEARAKEYGDSDQATIDMAVGAERAHRLAVLLHRAATFKAWQLEALLRHAALLNAVEDGGAYASSHEWEAVHSSHQAEVDRLERVVPALCHWGDEGIGYGWKDAS